MIVDNPYIQVCRKFGFYQYSEAYQEMWGDENMPVCFDSNAKKVITINEETIVGTKSLQTEYEVKSPEELEQLLTVLLIMHN